MPDGTPPLTTTAQTDAPAGGGGRRALVERQLGQLGEMVDIGLRLMRAIERQVEAAEAGPQPLAELNAAAMAYARVARAVRQSVMLQDRLTSDREAGDRAAAAGRERKAAVKARVAGLVRCAVEAEHDGAEQVERLCAEAAERLELELFGEGDALARPVLAVIADICRDLGLRPDWAGLVDEAAAVGAMARGEEPAGTDAAPQKLELLWLDEDGRLGPAPPCRIGTAKAARCDSG